MKHDIYNGVEFSLEGIKFWHENATRCYEYVSRCGMFTRNCPTCMYHVQLDSDRCEDLGIKPGMYCQLSVEKPKKS